jgi:hypothetical protein
VTVKISDHDNGLAAHKRKFEHNARVTVGVHAEEGGEQKETPGAIAGRKAHAAELKSRTRDVNSAARSLKSLRTRLSKAILDPKAKAKTREKLSAKIERAKEYHAFMQERAKNFGAEHHSPAGSALTLVEVAEFHEFGLGVPQRSFVAGAVDENEAELNAKLTNAMHEAAKPGGMGPERQLARFGLYVVGVMQERISAGIPPLPLAPATLKYKASVGVGQKEIPLILTGQLRSSIRSKVEVI